MSVVTTCVAGLAFIAMPSNVALAHNTLESSDPADGATFSAAPVQMTWVFAKSVPLDTMTITLIDATGVRSELTGSIHGAAGDSVVVTPLPALQPGSVSVRWRLVGPDGHPVTGRVDFTIAVAVTDPGNVVPTLSPIDASAAQPALSVPIATDDAASSSTPSVLRWTLRYLSYLAMVAIVGILLTSVFVWSGALSLPRLRVLLGRSLLLTAVLGFVQISVIAADISGKAPWASSSFIDAAATTDAGLALLVRIGLALGMWVLLFHSGVERREAYWTAATLCGLGLLATWAFAGHSRSLRWPTIGIAADVAHHAAGATWIAGLAIVGWHVLPRTPDAVRGPAVQRFSRVAAASVAVLVGTGVVQSIRLVGNPLNLLDATHGRLLLAKIIALAGMLGLAAVNRRRVATMAAASTLTELHVSGLRRAVAIEFAIGMAIIGLTAALVVSPPSISASTPRDPGASRPAGILHSVVVLERNPSCDLAC